MCPWKNGEGWLRQEGVCGRLDGSSGFGGACGQDNPTEQAERGASVLGGLWRGVLCFPFLGLWVKILGPGACLWGHTEFNRATAHSGPTSLSRNRLPTAVTTSLQVALETLLRTGVLAQLLSNRWCPPFRPHLRLLPSVFPPFQRHQEELL